TNIGNAGTDITSTAATFGVDVDINADNFYLGATSNSTFRHLTYNTQDVSTTAPISPGGFGPGYGRWVLISGKKDGAPGARFTDMLHLYGATANLISGGSTSGSPAARTYTMVSDVLNLAMAADTYDVSVFFTLGPNPQ
ncbi:hypothetical protein LCGC14_0730640, partial [marine sediment metagenome]